MTRQHIKSFVVKQSPIRDNDRFYSSDRFYVGTRVNGKQYYLRNDGTVCPRMQRSAIEPYGTYFLTQQEAQDCLDRYNARQEVSTISSDTQQDDNVQSTTSMVGETERSN